MSEAGHAETDTQANVQVPNDYLLRFHVAYFVAWRAEIEVATPGLLRRWANLAADNDTAPR